MYEWLTQNRRVKNIKTGDIGIVWEIHDAPHMKYEIRFNDETNHIGQFYSEEQMIERFTPYPRKKSHDET